MQTHRPSDEIEQARPYKRKIKNLMIHKPLQREFLFVVIALLMVSTLAIGFVIHGTIRDSVMGGGFHFGKISPIEILAEVRYDLVIRVSLILFITLIVLAFFGVSFLHRVAGPVYRFRQVFARINQGDLPTRIKLREGDFFGETAHEINLVIDRLAEDERKLAEMQLSLTQILAANPSQEVAQSARQLQALLTRKPLLPKNS